MIPEALFRTFLHDMKKNGALFFEMYFDETVTVYTDIFRGQAFPDKAEATRGVSLRAFDGENHVCVSTEDLTDSNLRSIVANIAKKMNPSNNKHPLRCSAPESIRNQTIPAPYQWTDRQSVIEKICAEQKKTQELLGEKTPIKTRCYFMDQKVQLLSSFNGSISSNRSTCCIVTETIIEGIRITNVLTPISRNDLIHTLHTSGLVRISKNTKQDPVTCPTGHFNLVLQSGSASLFFHECCGHPLEIYNAIHPDAIFHDMIGKKVADSSVSLCDDGSLNNYWGSISMDDEGNPAQKNILIRNGILERYLTDLVEGYRYSMEPTGNTRRQNYKKVPTARMTNTYIAEGNCKEQDIIRSTKEGLLIKSFSFGNVNPITGDFTVKITSGNIIRRGTVEEPFRGGIIRANALDVLSRIDRVADNLSLTNGFCHASSGRITVSGGQPTVRIAGVPVFGDV